jgi:hypothetical protein
MPCGLGGSTVPCARSSFNTVEICGNGESSMRIFSKVGWMKLVNEGGMPIWGPNQMSLVDASASCVGFNSSFFVLLIMLCGVQGRWAFVLVFPFVP